MLWKADTVVVVEHLAEEADVSLRNMLSMLCIFSRFPRT